MLRCSSLVGQAEWGAAEAGALRAGWHAWLTQDVLLRCLRHAAHAVRLSAAACLRAVCLAFPEHRLGTAMVRRCCRLLRATHGRLSSDAAIGATAATSAGVAVSAAAELDGKTKAGSALRKRFGGAKSCRSLLKKRRDGNPPPPRVHLAKPPGTRIHVP